MSYGSMFSGIGSGITSGYAGAVSERKAASAANRGNQAAQRAALEEEQKAYDLENEKMKPWEQFGDKSRLSFQDLLGYNGPDAQASALKSLQESTGYKARIQATDRSAAARGGLFSGRAALALQEAGSDEYDKEYGRRSNLNDKAYSISTDSANRGGTYYRNRRDIRSGTELRGGQIQAGKWKGYGYWQGKGNDTANAGFSGSSFGGGKKKDDGADSYDA